jgi:hypothetical protein
MAALTQTRAFTARPATAARSARRSSVVVAAARPTWYPGARRRRWGGCRLLRSAAQSRARARGPSPAPLAARRPILTRKRRPPPSSSAGATPPKYLNGSLVGDYGARGSRPPRPDPASAPAAAISPPSSPLTPPTLLSAPTGFDPLRLGANADLLPYYAEAELTNGRWAMAAVAGILFTDLVGLPAWWSDAQTATYALDTKTQLAVGVPLFAVLEGMRARGWERTGESGAFGMHPFDPLGKLSPEMRLKEVKNARLAMVAFLGFASQAAVRGLGPIECLKVRRRVGLGWAGLGCVFFVRVAWRLCACAFCASTALALRQSPIIRAITHSLIDLPPTAPPPPRSSTSRTPATTTSSRLRSATRRRSRSSSSPCCRSSSRPSARSTAATTRSSARSRGDPAAERKGWRRGAILCAGARASRDERRAGRPPRVI